MPYRAEVPLRVLSSERNNRLGFEAAWQVRVDDDLRWGDLGCRLTSQEDGPIAAVFENIQAPTEADAYLQASDALSVIVPLVSLEIQREHIDRHYGPMRAVWSRAELEIAPSDNWPAMRGAVRARRAVSLTSVNNDLQAVAQTPVLRQLLRSYDRALEPNDEETRFFNAFAIIEFIEVRFATPARFAPLVDDASVDAIVDAVRARARERALPANIIERLGNLITAPLRRGTVEGREAKLVAILRGDFGIQDVADGLGRQTLEVPFVRELTAARNRLFHGAAADAAGFARLTDRLTLIVEQVLRALLEGRLVLPPPP